MSINCLQGVPRGTGPMVGLGAPTSRPSGSVAAADGAPGWTGPVETPPSQGPEYCEGPLADTLAGKETIGN